MRSIRPLCTLGSTYLVLASMLFAFQPVAIAAGPSSNAPDGTSSTPYQLSADDQLDVSVMGHDDFKESVTILPDGTFNYPVIGTVHAIGLTVKALTQLIERGLSDQLNNPQVTVNVRASRARKITVVGAVKNAGQFDYKPGWRLLDGLAASGGPAQALEMTQATLITAGGKKSTPIDFDSLVSGASTSLNTLLAPGDVLIVQERDLSVVQTQVIGEVLKPGAYTVPADGVSVVSLLSQAGGATPKAALTKAQVLHLGKVIDVNLRPLMNRLDDSAVELRLKPGDVLLIPANTDTVSVLGEVKNPSDYAIPDGGKITVISALSDAGGTTVEANKGIASVVRRGADGKPVIIATDLNALLNGKAPDFDLHGGDILYIPSRKKSDFRPTDLLSLIPILTLFRR